MKGKTCIITGATDGIGLEAAARLGALGARLVLVGRNRDKGERALTILRSRVPGLIAEMHYADLSRRDEIRRLVPELLSAAPRIDVLLNNAGAFFARRDVTEDGLERTFALNHIGYFLLTHLLRDRVIASAPARIVNVASGAHRKAVLDFDDLQCAKRYSGWLAYQRSKLCNILFTRELARRLVGRSVTANSFSPGFVATRFGNQAGGIAALYLRIAKLFAGTQEQGAETLVWLASSPDVAATSGEYFYRGQRGTLTAAAQDDALARRLWDVSEELAAKATA